jgi:hypothetical protein
MFLSHQQLSLMAAEAAPTPLVCQVRDPARLATADSGRLTRLLTSHEHQETTQAVDRSKTANRPASKQNQTKDLSEI